MERTKAKASRRSDKAPDATDSAVDQVIEVVKQRIFEGRYAPGQRLIEPELMHDLGFSRGPIREALRRLTAEGLVEWERYRGATVCRMSRQQAKDFGELRALIEGYAAGLAATNINSQGRAALLKVEQLWNKPALTRSVTYGQYNTKFHETIRALGGNREIEGMLDRTVLPIFRIQFAPILLSDGQIERSHADHEKILAAILNGDAKTAESEMRRHVQHATKVILAAPDHYFSNREKS
jgi:DNA-binding GntR family transcriptional regulator